MIVDLHGFWAPGVLAVPGFRREVELPLILERASSTYLRLDIPVIRMTYGYRIG
jgi:hypothetical protein